MHSLRVLTTLGSLLPILIGSASAGADATTTAIAPPAARAAHTTTPADTIDAAVARATDAVPPRVDRTPSVAVAGLADESQLRALDDGLARFREHGLDLPDLVVRFSDDPTDCRGHYGLFEREPSPWRLSVCSELPFVITHELAHAWLAAHLDDADRLEYIDARGLSTWSDADVAWNERGVEDAAFIIQQNLMAQHADPSSPMWRERMAAFELLTGRPSPVGGR